MELAAKNDNGLPMTTAEIDFNLLQLSDGIKEPVCKNCKWFSKLFGTEITNCNGEPASFVTKLNSMFQPPSDFWCKYWEEKENKK